LEARSGPAIRPCISSRVSNLLLAGALACASMRTVAAQQDASSRSAVVEARSQIVRADSLSQRGQWAEAGEAWRAVVTANPYAARGWYALGLAEQNAGNVGAAIQACERYVDLGGAPPAERRCFGGNAPAAQVDSAVLAAP
ncbi:MAG TPA: bacterial transcriptional activator domain-containing protein, partial [Gemmatimonadales bacterium]|nr:bacterial transcriptional activator domain-containing protein [Gemmatimonadales bacterium]